MTSPGVKTNHEKGGYECEFVKTPPDYFQTECSVCLLVLRSPHITSCCAHTFCKECIERIKNDGMCCPLCNAEEFILTYNRAHDRSLKQLEVYCTHRKVGCEWQGKVESLDKHLNIEPDTEKQLEGCAYVEVQCCHDGCELSFQRCLVTKHQLECPQQPFTCEHCRSYKATHHDLMTNHWPVCKSYPLSCPNKCTDNTIRREHLEQHLNKECPLQEIDCEFKYAGCEIKLPRKDMPEHLKENIGHITLLTRQNQELLAKLLEKDETIERMEERLEELASKQDETSSYLEKLCHHVSIAPVQIVMPDFQQHKNDKDAWYNKGFYTHPQGYNMCLRVDADGLGDGSGTHVSCFVCLIQGEFDNHLKWPFRGIVTVQLLNQRENNNHHTKTTRFGERTPASCAERVTGGEGRTTGWGQQTFIAHSELDHTPATNRQYLMNDCLYFQVKVELT